MRCLHLPFSTYTGLCQSRARGALHPPELVQCQARSACSMPGFGDVGRERQGPGGGSGQLKVQEPMQSAHSPQPVTQDLTLLVQEAENATSAPQGNIRSFIGTPTQPRLIWVRDSNVVGHALSPQSFLPQCVWIPFPQHGRCSALPALGGRSQARCCLGS